MNVYITFHANNEKTALGSVFRQLDAAMLFINDKATEKKYNNTRWDADFRQKQNIYKKVCLNDKGETKEIFYIVEKKVKI